VTRGGENPLLLNLGGRQSRKRLTKESLLLKQKGVWPRNKGGSQTDVWGDLRGKVIAREKVKAEGITYYKK